MKVLVLGISGLLGSALFRVLSGSGQHEVWGTLRSDGDRRLFASGAAEAIVSGVDVLQPDALISVLGRLRPDVVVNCVGVVKQLAASEDPLQVLPINALFPHRLANLCALIGARLIHISTDCVFSGRGGDYREDDPVDAQDLYGKSKHLGEVCDQPHVFTLRTSIIGHEPKTSHSLVDWFLAQQGRVAGYTRAVFSGLPAVELASVLAERVLPRPDLAGLYHLSAAPIAKYDLLRLVAETYGKQIEIVPDDRLVVNRALNSDKFRSATGYVAPPWPELVQRMYRSRRDWSEASDV